MYEIRTNSGKTIRCRNLSSARRAAKNAIGWQVGGQAEIVFDNRLLQRVEIVEGPRRKWTPTGQNRPLQELLDFPAPH